MIIVLIIGGLIIGIYLFSKRSKSKVNNPIETINKNSTMTIDDNVLDISISEELIEIAKKTVFLGLGLNNNHVYPEYIEFIHFICSDIYINQLSAGSIVTSAELKENLIINTKTFIKNKNITCQIDRMPYFYDDVLFLSVYFLKCRVNKSDIFK